jgi:hypothetical protein
VVIYLHASLDLNPQTAYGTFILLLFSGLPPSPLFYLKIVIMIYVYLELDFLYLTFLRFLIVSLAGIYSKFIYDNFPILKKKSKKFALSNIILSYKLVGLFILTPILLAFAVD